MGVLFTSRPPNGPVVINNTRWLFLSFPSISSLFSSQGKTTTTTTTKNKNEADVQLKRKNKVGGGGTAAS